MPSINKYTPQKLSCAEPFHRLKSAGLIAAAAGRVAAFTVCRECCYNSLYQLNNGDAVS
ncbi:hypothetical protein DCCM_3992 [Desulfocucumis palustris]|uniref:Uncharacterized protein n=1 Tax=Desulfocucumis palustris TaxID=1898651 RepID=A0A2L2XFG5_9FIRM|nr:hypothetical protein DCCM_3992 [Desulfocucumis palustris]